jgi:hypothetical protein
VPEALRADGWDLITLAEHYGMPADEQVADTEWIEEAAKRGWPIPMKDKRIRHRQAEIAAVPEHKAHCSVITRGDLPSADMARRFIANVAGLPGISLHWSPPAAVDGTGYRVSEGCARLRGPLYVWSQGLAVKASQVAGRSALGLTTGATGALSERDRPQEAVSHDATARGRRPRTLNSQALPRRTAGVACAILLARSSMRRMSAKVLARSICRIWQAR